VAKDSSVVEMGKLCGEPHNALSPDECPALGQPRFVALAFPEYQ